jgi:hypothetical protein
MPKHAPKYLEWALVVIVQEQKHTQVIPFGSHRVLGIGFGDGLHCHLARSVDKVT